ncbi:uncharacterized protein FA14DRAFT_161752 [Meira miltonrushii]|uniref:Pentacotripeptide-repeat region of PRORP domain-containing protein n=1 Tax=Meira miltonrushii TaxID=1280837 RepID=A0A316V9S2_9BASI|nr:uncharacterized protein FA14DRAFT_161752 [Meira miltonrushii]PWN34317.1 hypothetical protein FA14DRAFT_161752 [Meira miltonrushii]
MPISMATKLGIQFARFAAASGNAGSSGLRGALNNAASGSSSATSSWTQGLSSGGASSTNGAGIGGAKFHAGRGAHSSFQQSGRALANANASSSNDGSNSIGDDDEDLAAQQARIHRPGQLHRSGLIGRHISQSHARLVRSKRESYITSLPALQLILPRAEHSLLNSSASPAHVRTLTNDASTSSPQPIKEALSPSEEKPILQLENANQKPTKTIQKRRPGRSHSMGATVGRRTGLLGNSESTDLGPMLNDASRPFSPVRIEESQSRSPEEQLIQQAIEEEDSGKMRSAVHTYRKLDPSRQSVSGFNKALQALLQIIYTDAEKDTNDIVATYLQMIEADKRPNARTWELLTRALCERDLILNSEHITGKDDESFDQAFSLFKLAHASGAGGFFTQRPYNKLLLCCSLRGDTEKACDVFQQMASNKHVEIDRSTFRFLLNCFAKDRRLQKDESEQERDARIISQTRQIFETFERKRAVDSIDNSNDSGFSHSSVIWNTMIKIHYDCNDIPGALMLIEKMLTDSSAPLPTSSTSRIIIKKLLEKGESVDAMKWVNKIIDSQLQAKGDNAHGHARCLPLPVVEYPSMDTANRAGIEDLPLVQILNRVASGFIEIYRDTKLDEESRKNLYSSVRIALLANSHVFDDSILKNNVELTSTLMDDSLQLILKHSELNDNTTGEDEILSADLAKDSRFFARTILIKVIQPLIELRRFQDAISAFTYAIHYHLLLPDVRSRVERVREEGMHVADSVFAIRDSVKLLTGDNVPQLHRIGKPLDASEREQYAFQMLVASVQMLVPSLVPLHQSEITEDLNERVVELYNVVRGQVAPEDLPFSSKDWSTLLDVFAAHETMKENGFDRDSGCIILLEDLAKLPRETVQELDLTRVGTIALSKYPSDANMLLAAIDPSLAQQIMESSPEARLSPDGGSNADATSEATTTLTFESILDGFTSPPSSIGESVAQQAYAPIQLIDEDLCAGLLVQNAGSRRSKFSQAIPADPEGAYDRLMTSISETGTYPTVRSIGAMMVTAGRNGNLDRVQQLYVVGCHVVASLGGDIDWQQWSWASLENEMITGLAHAGEAKAASDHRHRLINAGHVPTANAYAALITVVRDTTDDAMIAEELYQESQRLNVEPNVFLYNTVISKLCRARKMERALQLFEEMRQRGLNPSSVTYGALINGSTRIGDEAKAEELYAVMESDRMFKPQAPPFNTMIQFYVHSQPDRSKALAYYDRMLHHNVEPTAHTYKLLLDAYGTIEPVDIVGMQDIFGRLIAARKVNVDGAHWASVITAHGIHCQDLQRAIQIFDSIPNHVSTRRSKLKLPDALTYEAILNVFLTHNRFDLMQIYFAKLRQNDIHPTAYLANLMIRGLAFAQGVEPARDLFAEMHDPPMGVAAIGNHPPNHRHHANGAHIKSYEAQSAGDGLYGFQNVLREPSTFEAMIKVEMQFGQKENAIVLLERMKERGYPPAIITKASSFLTADAPIQVTEQQPSI